MHARAGRGCRAGLQGRGVAARRGRGAAGAGPQARSSSGSRVLRDRVAWGGRPVFGWLLGLGPVSCAAGAGGVARVACSASPGCAFASSVGDAFPARFSRRCSPYCVKGPRGAPGRRLLPAPLGSRLARPGLAWRCREPTRRWRRAPSRDALPSFSRPGFRREKALGLMATVLGFVGIKRAEPMTRGQEKGSPESARRNRGSRPASLRGARGSPRMFWPGRWGRAGLPGTAGRGRGARPGKG